MKKIFIILLLILLINTKKENINTVFNEENEYNTYILTFPNKNLSTNNYDEYFLNKKVLWVEPYVNEIYKDKILKYKRYYFENNHNINRFKEKYINYIEDIGYKREAINLKIDGIKILKLKIYCTNKEINAIKLRFDNVLIDKIS